MSVTANDPPEDRKRGESNWSAGPAADWCEVASLDGLLTANLAAAVISLREPANPPRSASGGPVGPSRIARQAAAHALGVCTRPAPHWPASE